MVQYIDKATLVAEIKRISCENPMDNSWYVDTEELLNFLDTLEVKEVHECNDVDLNPLFEEMGVEPDSRIALMFKNAFYKSVDNYLGKKENKL